MDYRTFLRARHAIVVGAMVIIIATVRHVKDDDDQTLLVLAFILVGFSLFFERCRNCKGIFWLQSGRYFFNRYIGPFYLPSRCGRCGSLDFEKPPVEG